MLEEERLCLLVLIGVRADGSKELIALADGHRESAGSWADLLRDAKRRGMRAPVLAVASSLYRAVYVRRDARSLTCGSRTSSTPTACPPPAPPAPAAPGTGHRAPTPSSNQISNSRPQDSVITTTEVSHEVDREGTEMAATLPGPEPAVTCSTGCGAGSACRSSHRRSLRRSSWASGWPISVRMAKVRCHARRAASGRPLASWVSPRWLKVRAS